MSAKILTNTVKNPVHASLRDQIAGPRSIPDPRLKSIVGRVIFCNQCETSFVDINHRYMKTKPLYSRECLMVVDRAGKKHLLLQDGNYIALHTGNGKLCFKRMGAHDHLEDRVEDHLHTILTQHKSDSDDYVSSDSYPKPRQPVPSVVGQITISAPCHKIAITLHHLFLKEGPWFSRGSVLLRDMAGRRHAIPNEGNYNVLHLGNGRLRFQRTGEPNHTTDCH